MDSIGYFGKYFIEDRETGALVGMAKIEKYGTEVDLGYRILEEFWGKGIATEVTQKLILFSLLNLKTKGVCAFVDTSNEASIRVLEKSGMQNIELIEDLGDPRYKFQYVLRNPFHKLWLRYVNLTR
jgi:RimJ/RimL family protein N-acetyltransferase